jgi:putative monooxygenase
MNRTEVITAGDGPVTGELAPGVELRIFATGKTGAQGLTTGTATFRPGADLPYHRHPMSEVIVVLGGQAQVFVEGRRYILVPFDALHLPPGTAHRVRNDSPEIPAVLFSTFASDAPTRELVADRFSTSEGDASTPNHQENLLRFETAPVYELAPRAFFRDLFARRFGARGICGGHGIFEPGASLPCHLHGFDESITIVAGHAICQVAGKEYELSGCGTACIPKGRPHRFLNRSSQPMAMVWVYAGDEPERTLVDPGFCEGLLPL